MERVAVVTFAKQHSERLPEKNLKTLFGKPLLRWTIDFAKRLKYNYYIFTQSKAIRDISKDCYIIDEPDWCMPDSMNICKKFKFVNEIMKADIIILLQATSPIRSLYLANKWITKFMASDYTSGYSVCNGRSNGAFYIFRKEQLQETNIRDSFSMLFEDYYDIDIDTQEEFDRAEEKIKEVLYK